MQRKEWATAGLLTATVGGDALTTWYGIEHAGLYEANPVVLGMLESSGYVSLVAMSVALLAFTGAVSYAMDRWAAWHARRHRDEWDASRLSPENAWLTPIAAVALAKGVFTLNNVILIAAV